MLSVIIPTWNRERFLKKAITSVLGQSLPCSELVIVDDGSTDETARVVKQIAATTEIPVRYLFQQNRGPAAARNKGIMAAKGDVLCFLDSDDWWDKNKIELQWRAFKRQRQYIISHTRETWYRRGKRVNQKKKHAPPHGEIFSRCLRMCVIGMSTVMVRRQLFDRYGLFDESLACCEDYDLWLRVSRCEPFQLVDEPLTLKDGGRLDQLSRIHRTGMDTFRISSLCNLLDTRTLSIKQHDLTVAELERKCTIYGNGCIKHGREEEGRQYLALPEVYRIRKSSVVR